MLPATRRGDIPAFTTARLALDLATAQGFEAEYFGQCIFRMFFLACLSFEEVWKNGEMMNEKY